VTVTLAEITDRNRAAVLALRVAPGQERFVGSVRRALAKAAEYPDAKPWYRAVCADGEPVGFVMVSWDVVPQPPQIIGPWFLWKLLIDERQQGHGYGAQDGGPAGFYERLGFVPAGQLDTDGEVIVRLMLA
jgi:diamine N-acetyltransferase